MLKRLRGIKVRDAGKGYEDQSVSVSLTCNLFKVNLKIIFISVQGELNTQLVLWAVHVHLAYGTPAEVSNSCRSSL